MHVAMPKWPINQFEPVQQRRKQVQRAYCPHMYCKYEASDSHLCVKNPLLARGQRSCLRGSSFVAENGCEVILGGSDRLEPM